MYTDAAQLGPVAPWLDVANSYQRHWARIHRWKNPEYFSEYNPELLPALAELDALPGRGLMRPRAAEDPLWASTPP